MPELAETPTQPMAREARLRSVGLAFRAAYHGLRRLRGRHTQLGHGGVGNAQYELLARLKEEGPLPAGELAGLLGVSAATVSQMVDGLVDAGYAERVRSGSDRRVVAVKLTRRGHAWVVAKSAVWRERWAQALEGFDDDELRIAAAVLERISLIFDEADG